MADSEPEPESQVISVIYRSPEPSGYDIVSFQSFDPQLVLVSSEIIPFLGLNSLCFDPKG